MKDNLEIDTHPFKLTTEMQDIKGKEVYDAIVFSNLRKKPALKKLKLHNCTDKAKNIIIKNTMAIQEELGKVSIQELEHEHSIFKIK